MEFNHTYGKKISILISLLCISLLGFTQPSCPPNIDAEFGNFTNWQCYVGSVSAAGNSNVINVTPSVPVVNRHEVYSNAGNTGLDQYGLFPVACPNGSGYSIKLGNNLGGRGAEQVSYTFTIPSNVNDYSLVYWYAVVFQNPNHQIYQQPRFIANVFNATSNDYIGCASFTYVGSSGLPGFEQSPVNNEVIFKKWTPVTVNLRGYAGQTIRIEFTTADCTEGGHFGYAYLDINSQCSQPVQGAAYCLGAESVTLTAPFGYESYQWFTANFLQLLGNQQELTLSPPPADSTLLAVIVNPYNGFGCKDTVYTRVRASAPPDVFVGNDTSICKNSVVTLGMVTATNWAYQWSPITGLSNPFGSITMANPSVSTAYTLTVSDTTGGCSVTDTVNIAIKPSPTAGFAIDTTCVNITARITNTTEYSGNDGLIYTWDFGNGDYSNQQTPVYSFSNPGMYNVRLAVATAQCPADSSQLIKTVTILAPPKGQKIRFSTVYNEALQLHTINTGHTYIWHPGQYLNNTLIASPVFSGNKDVTYLVEIINDANCVVTDTVVVTVDKTADIFVPKAFTPNNDGVNDKAFPFLISIKELYFFRIWNRWGQLVYESKTDLPGWDGYFNNQPQPADAYVWEAAGITHNNKVIKRKGVINLIR